MSRCFPYPPPGYHRNGAIYEALIESIKLQKKTHKTKAERKLQKKAKKEREEKQQTEKINSDGSNKVLQKVAEAQVKKPEPTTELFENSDLTQEHGQPVSPHQPSYSSDSTQNSNKRKRDDATLLPDTSMGHGKPFKIRFLKKHKGPNSDTDRRPVSCIGVNSVSANLIQTDSDPSFTKPNLSFGRQVVSGTRLEHEVPSSSGSRTYKEQGIHSGRPLQLVLSHDGKRYVSQTNTLLYNGGKTIDPMQKDVPQKVGPTRAEKKRLKKHAKYEKLIGSWRPPVVGTQPGGGDDDWLCRGVKTANQIPLRGKVEMCRELVVPRQPCARFLADVDIHVMPYTVPF